MYGKSRISKKQDGVQPIDERWPKARLVVCVVLTREGEGGSEASIAFVSELYGGTFYGTRVGWELGVRSVGQNWFDREQ